MQNWRSDTTGLGKPGETHRLTGTGPGLARQVRVGPVFGRVWNRTNKYLQSNPGSVASYLDPLLTLLSSMFQIALPDIFPAYLALCFQVHLKEARHCQFHQTVCFHMSCLVFNLET